MYLRTYLSTYTASVITVFSHLDASFFRREEGNDPRALARERIKYERENETFYYNWSRERKLRSVRS